MHFSNRLKQEAASAFGILAADAIVQDLCLMLARISWSFSNDGGAKFFQTRSLGYSRILVSILGFFLGSALLLLFLFALVLLTGIGLSLVTVVHRMRNRCDRRIIHVLRPFDVAILCWGWHPILLAASFHSRDELHRWR
jgi:amino acid transporter